MILDSFKSFEKYQTIQVVFDKAYQCIKNNELNALDPGEYDIDGKNV